MSLNDLDHVMLTTTDPAAHVDAPSIGINAEAFFHGLTLPFQRCEPEKAPQATAGHGLTRALFAIRRTWERQPSAR